MKRIMLFTAISMIAIAAYALQLSEFIVTPTPSEAVEIHNESGATLDITGYKIILTAATWADTGTFPAYTMAAGEYKSYPRADLTSSTLSNDGLIIKITDAGGTTLDSVAYGYMGPAPAPIYNFSTARVGSSTKGIMADSWNMDTTPTMGSANDVPGTDLGNSDVLINEIYADTLATQFIELYNSSGASVDISDWFVVCDDDYFFPASTSVPANGYLVIYDTDWTATASFFYLEPSENIYLYNATGVRLDQCGFEDLPADSSFSVRPNGVRTVFDGYDNATSPDFELWGPTPAAANPVETFSTNAHENDFSVFSIHGTGIGIENLNNVSGNVSITDVAGRVLYTSFLKNMTFVTKSGIYFVHISTETGSTVIKTAVIR